MKQRFDMPDGSRNANPPGIGFWSLVREDLKTHNNNLGSQGFWAVFWHRFGNWRMGVRPKMFRAPLTVIYRTMHKASEIFGGISIPYSIPLGRRVCIEHFGGIVISARGIGDDVIIRQNTTLGLVATSRTRERPLIGNRVDIGVGAAILGAINIGDDVRIGANAVVLVDVPTGCVAVGVPARVIHPKSGPGRE